MGGMLEGGVSTCIVQAGEGVCRGICVGDMVERSMAILIACVFGMLYNQEDFNPKKKWSIEDPYPSVPVQAAQTSSTFFCSTSPYILGIYNKKEADYISCMCCRFSLLFNTESSVCLTIYP